MAKKRVKWKPAFLISLLAAMLVIITAAVSKVTFHPVCMLEKITAPDAALKKSEKKPQTIAAALPEKPGSAKPNVHAVAENGGTPKPQPDKKKDILPILPMQVGTIFDTAKPVFGVNFGGMSKQQEIYGLSLAAMHAYNHKKGGVTLSFLDFCQDNYGLAFTFYGGAVRHYGFALGGWNLAEYNHGVQVGLVNQAYPGAMLASGMERFKKAGQDVKISFDDGTEDKKAVKDKSFGVQVGLINRSEGRGLQFGLWNVNPNAWLTHFPLFNFAF